jgi:hypothetical protein
MIDFIIKIEVALFILFWIIQTVVIVPTLRRFKKVHWFDWLASGPHQISNLLEYKQFCLKENEPVFWFNIQMIIFGLFIGNLFLIYFLSYQGP